MSSAIHAFPVFRYSSTCAVDVSPSITSKLGEASKRLTSHKLGYFCLVTEGTESVQILPPTWQIELDNEEVYFVNAIDGGVQTVERLDTVSEK